MMRRMFVLLAMLAMFHATPASADSFVLGSTYSTVSYTLNAHNYTAGGGSFDVSKLSGEDLPWVYCVDLYHYVSPNGTYSNTLVRHDGVVNGSSVNSAAEVAWLLDNYAAGAAGNAAKEAALQGLIWKAIYGSNFTFHPTSTQDDYYVPWLNAGFGTGNVSKYLWLTPDSRCLNDSCYAPDCKQGLVTYQSVPDAGSTLLLLSAGLMGLAAWRRRHP
jgi:hypothetical protein